jgi:hypothetical protein
MQASGEIKSKLALVIGQLISRCIEEARKVPYILDQQEAVDILVGNPALFAKLVCDEEADRIEFSREKLTASLDAVKELGQFEALDGMDMSFSCPMESTADLAPIVETINQLTRTFIVYVGNTVTIVEKERELFAEKLRQWLQKSGLSLRTVQLYASDMGELEQSANAYLLSGQFLQAFLFGHLLSSSVIAGDVVRLPSSSSYSLNENLIRTGLLEAGLFPNVVRFILRACYISQGQWEDLFEVLVRFSEEEAQVCTRSQLVDMIEQDAIFCCNLLGRSFPDLRRLQQAERRSAIERTLQGYRLRARG